MSTTFSQFSFSFPSGDAFTLAGAFGMTDLREALTLWSEQRGSTATAPVLAAISALHEELTMKLDDVLAKLGTINEQTNRMATAQEEQGTALTDVAGDITALKALVIAGKDDAAAADQALAGLDSVAAKVTAAADAAAATAASLKAVAAEFPEPTPEPDPNARKR